jgi:phosphonate metabolism-associated iron-containing alcohol dehydrogenase
MHRLPSLLPELGRVLLVTTEGFARRGLTQQLVQLLGSARVTVFDQITPNPQLDDLDRAAIQLRQAGIGSIVALGGGSVMDAAKVLAITLTSTLDDPLADVFRRGGQLAGTPRLPLTAIPTTSGTGAEVTPFATVWDQTTHTKHSLAGEHMYPAHALLDPELTLSLPHEETLYPGLDAISHSLESIWNKNRTPISASFALQALALAAQALPIVLGHPSDLPARSRMQQASLLAGLAISQTRTAVAHSISYPLTSYFGVPHGLACSFTLPELLRLNIGGLITAYPREESLFLSVQRVLDGLRLPELLSRYATPADIMKLQAAMSTKGRIDNFVGDMGAGLADVIEKSLT